MIKTAPGIRPARASCLLIASMLAACTALPETAPPPGTPGAAAMPYTSTPISPATTPAATQTPLQAAASSTAEVEPTSLPTLSEPTLTPTAASFTHVVQAGETLFRIALRYGVTVEALRAANGLAGDTIYVAQVLVIPEASAPSAPPANTPTFSPTPPPLTTLPASPTPGATVTTTSSPTASACQFVWFFTHAPARCPVGPPTPSDGATQRFERGQMIWVRATDTFFILFNANTLPNDSRLAFIQLQSLRLKPGASADHRVREAPPPGLHEPVSGFGLIWRGEVEGEFPLLSSLTMRQALGWAVESESGFDTSYQCETPSTYSDRTCYLRASDGRIIVLGYGAYTGNVWWVYVWPTPAP